MRTKRILWPLCVVSWLLTFSGVAAAAAITSHVVTEGQSLSVIARENGVVDANGDGNWQRLCDANVEVKNPNLIHVGQEIRIPDAGEQIEHRSECVLPVPVVSPPTLVAQATTKVTESAARSRVSSSAQPRTNSPVETSSASGGAFAQLRECESGGNYANKENSTYRGAYQFDLSTWQSVGGSGDPADASVAEQDQRAATLQARRGWAPWPSCSAQLGLK